MLKLDTYVKFVCKSCFVVMRRFVSYSAGLTCPGGCGRPNPATLGGSKQREVMLR